jgi:site-specific DNA-cytosine methylase
MDTAPIEPDILDFFVGPGGWDRGAELAGIDPRRITGVELDPAAVETARATGYNGSTATSWTRHRLTSRTSAD